MQDYNRGRVIGAVEVIEHIAAGNEDVQAACATIRDAISYEEWEPTQLVDADAEDKPKKTCADTRRDFQEFVDRKVSEAETQKTIEKVQQAIDAEKASTVLTALDAIKRHRIKFTDIASAMKVKPGAIYSMSRKFKNQFTKMFKLHTEAPA